MSLKIVFEQINLLVGDIEENANKIIATANEAAKKHHADLVVYPELAVSSYPIEDLVYRPALYKRTQLALKKIAENVNTSVIVGYPAFENNKRFNKACVISNGKIIADYAKRELPNYTVFDEKRYFTSGNQPCVFQLKGHDIGLVICEDTWFATPIRDSVEAGAKILISINASPFAHDKENARHATIEKQAKHFNLPILYGNLIGGQDELVFDGGSFLYDKNGNLHQQADYFKEAELVVEFDENDNIISNKTHLAPLKEEEKVYAALVLGVRDYIKKNHFNGALLGLSGGVDSALTLAIAADAIGAENVHAVMMPSQFTSEMSLEDAKKIAEALQVKYSVIDIEAPFEAFKEALKEEFKGLKPDVTEENIQARCRGVILMALSNKKGNLVLTTGNKSELAVGYATLYGDMAGGFAVLKDIFKTLVYRLCEYRNAINPVIPERVLTRAPSAELAEGQTDQDNLPPYPVLDEILDRYIAKDESPETISAAGFDEAMVKKVIGLINKNEYKRRQAAPGIRITTRAFGKDRRYPITSAYFKN